MTDEVLVHISTPATRQNDELFRSLANAYTAFQPSRIYQDEPARKRVRLDPSTELPMDVDLPQVDGTATGAAANSSMLTTSKESYGSFPSDFSSEGPRQYPDSGSIHTSSMRPTSRLAQLDRSYLSWQKRAAPKSSFARVQRQPPESFSETEDAETGFIEDSQLAVQALQSQLHDTYSTTSADTSEDEDYQDDNYGNIENSPAPRDSSKHGQYSEVAEDLPSPILQDEPGYVDAIPRERLSDELTDPSNHVSRNDLNKGHAITEHGRVSVPLDFSKLPADAFPPAPTISVARPDTLPSQITNHLAVIKTQNPDRFEPQKVRRALDNDERGYWLVDCVQWLPELQLEFWSSLHEHVRSGRIGWGVTAHRETKSGWALGRVKLYCWGEIAEHLWLLLWLCSKGKVSEPGLRWIDSNNVVVLEM